jgi:hypothetical protein
MSERQDKIQLLSRLNRGRVAAPSFLVALGQVLGTDVRADSLLSLPQTDVLTQAFKIGYQQASKSQAISFRRSFAQHQAQSFLKLIDCFAGLLTKEDDVVFLTKLSDVCGAVLVSAPTLLRHAEAVINFDGDSLSALSGDQQQGVLLDFNSDDTEHYYEVTVWGDRWAILILGCVDRRKDA